MEIRGKIIKKFELESGTSKSGNEWKKQSVLIEQNTKYNKIVQVNAFGDKALDSLNKFEEGDTVDVSVNAYSREYHGRYYTQLDGYWWANKNLNTNKEENQFVSSDDEQMPF